jgi:hypothetical protein
MRQIDKERITAQIEFINRITKGGQIDYEAALKERFALAERLQNRRPAFIEWMKKQGFPSWRISEELSTLDRLIKELLRDPLKNDIWSEVS